MKRPLIASGAGLSLAAAAAMVAAMGVGEPIHRIQRPIQQDPRPHEGRPRKTKGSDRGKKQHLLKGVRP